MLLAFSVAPSGTGREDGSVHDAVRNGEGSNLSRFEIACEGGVRDSELACGRP